MKQLNKLALRILSIVFVIVIIALNVIFVSATPNESFPSSQIQPQNWTEEDRVGPVTEGYEWYQIEPWSQGYYVRIRERNLYQDTSTYKTDKGLANFTYQVGPMHVPSQGDQYYWRYDFDFQYFYNGRFLDLAGLNNDCKFYFEFNLEWLVATGTVISYNQPSFNKPTINYYDSTGKYLSSQEVYNAYHFDPDNNFYKSVMQGNFILPETARYCTVSFDVYNFGITSTEFCTFSFNVSNVDFQIGKPEKLIVQNYQNIGTLVSTGKYTHNWRIDNSANIGSAYMTSTTDPDLSSKNGLDYNIFNFVAKPTSTYQYTMRFRMFYPNRFLTLENLPKGTTTGIVAKFHIFSTVDWNYPNIQIAINYFDANFKAISGVGQQVYINRNYEWIDDSTGGSVSANIVLDYPDNAKYLTVNLILGNFYIYGSSNEEVTCICDQFEFWIGEKIETPEFPTGEDLGDLSGSLDVEKPDIDDILNNFDATLDKPTLLKVAELFAIFWDIDFMLRLMLLMFAFSFLSIILFGGH